MRRIDFGKKLRCPKCKNVFTFDPRSAYDRVRCRILRLDLIGEYAEQLENGGEQFPFLREEFRAIRWHLDFVTVGFAIHRLEERESHEFFRFFVQFLDADFNSIRVGDYVNAEGHLSLIKKNIGLRRFTSTSRELQIPSRLMSQALLTEKFRQVRGATEVAESSGKMLDWNDYIEIAKLCSFAILISYWGRIPDETADSLHLDALAELIYEEILGVDRMIGKSLA